MDNKSADIHKLHTCNKELIHHMHVFGLLKYTILFGSGEKKLQMMQCVSDLFG